MDVEFGMASSESIPSQQSEDQTEKSPKCVDWDYYIISHCGRVSFSLQMPDREFAQRFAIEMVNNPDRTKKTFTDMMQEIELSGVDRSDTTIEIEDGNWWFEFCDDQVHSRVGPYGLTVSKSKDAETKPAVRYQRVKELFETMMRQTELYGGNRIPQDQNFDTLNIDWDNQRYNRLGLFMDFLVDCDQDSGHDEVTSYGQRLKLKFWEDPLEYQVIMFELFEMPINFSDKSSWSIIKRSDIQLNPSEETTVSFMPFHLQYEKYLKHGNMKYDQILHPTD